MNWAWLAVALLASCTAGVYLGTIWSERMFAESVRRGHRATSIALAQVRGLRALSTVNYKTLEAAEIALDDAEEELGLIADVAEHK